MRAGVSTEKVVEEEGGWWVGNLVEQLVGISKGGRGGVVRRGTLGDEFGEEWEIGLEFGFDG